MKRRGSDLVSTWKRRTRETERSMDGSAGAYVSFVEAEIKRRPLRGRRLLEGLDSQIHEVLLVATL